MSGADAATDLEAIRQLKARYFRLLDTKRWEEWADLFTEHCEIQYFSRPESKIHGRDALVSSISTTMAGTVSAHQGFMPELELTGERIAKGIWAMTDYVVVQPAEGRTSGRTSIRGYGHYHETYEKGADGRWRIATLRLTRLRVEKIPA